MKLTLEVAPGEQIRWACTKASITAAAAGINVHFNFNDTLMIVKPGEIGGDVEDRYWKIKQEAEEERKRKSLMDPSFAFHKLNSVGIGKAEQIAEAFDLLLEKLKELCPEGREFSIVKTKLEEASFFSKKSMAMKTDNQA